MYLIIGLIISVLYFALSTSSFTVPILLNILYSYLLSGSGNKEIKTPKLPQISKLGKMETNVLKTFRVKFLLLAYNIRGEIAFQVLRNLWVAKALRAHTFCIKV